MREALNLILDDEDVLELMRILLDDDEQAAVAWLRAHLEGRAREIIEGRSRPGGRRP